MSYFYVLENPGLCFSEPNFMRHQDRALKNSENWDFA